jgi:signal transduction histidine kinase
VILYDERIDLTGQAGLHRKLISSLTGSGDRIDVFREEMDLSRVASSEYMRSLRSHIRIKYAGKKIEAVVAVMGPALDFLLDDDDSVFPAIPIIFCGLSREELGERALPKRVTGVLLKRAIAPTIDLALGVHPDTERIAFVAGSSPFDARVVAEAKAQLAGYESRVAITYLVGQPLPVLQTSLARLPAKTVVMLGPIFQDGAGIAFDPYKAAEIVSSSANVPVYGYIDGYVGRGVLGGRFNTMATQGEEAARLVLQVLEGKKPSSIPIVESTVLRDLFDWRQMTRWNVSMSELPAEAEVLHRPASLWHDYRREVLIALGVCIMQSLLILGILREHHRRNRAQLEAQGFARQLISAREAERGRIARELHDNVGQKLAMLAIEVGLLDREMSGRGSLSERVHSLENHTRSAATELRGLSHQLYPATIEFTGLVSALDELCREISKFGIVKIDFISEAVPRTIPSEATLCLYRIAQEALQNVVKHSAATQAQVRLSFRDPALLQLDITDNGRGFAPGDVRPDAIGLLTMRERAFLLGGEFESHSAPGAGTHVRTRIRLADAETTKPGKAA